MSKNLFLPNWKNFVDNTLVDCITNHLESDDSVVLKDFNFLDYTRGITFDDELRENGMYVFRFSDGKYYIGKASSCTMLERIAKHIDGRGWGGFNAVLKSLGQKEVKPEYHINNQKAFLEAKVVLIPISKTELMKNSKAQSEDKLLHKLESDLIVLFKKRFSDNTDNSIMNKTDPNKLSGLFNF